MKLSKIIAEKSRDVPVPAIDYRASLRDVARMMEEKHISALMVTDQDHFDPLHYKGIFTVLQFVEALSRGANPDDRVENHMITRMIVATGDDDVEYVVNVMIRHKISHLPVIANKRVAAIISMADILEIQNIEKDIQLHWMSDFTGSPGGDWNKVF